MNAQVEAESRKRWAIMKGLSGKKRITLLVLGLAVMLSGVVGVLIGVSLERINFYERAMRKVEKLLPLPEVQIVHWKNTASLYEQLRIAEIRVSTRTATGGSIEVLGGNILIASPQGRFSYLDPEYRLRDLPIKTRMNVEGLRNDPLYKDPRFQVASLRTHDLLAIQSSANEYDVYASFDRFAGQCIEFVISRIRLRVDDKGIVPVSRWDDVWSAHPCLRFKDRGSLLEGWQQGGRMVQKGEDEILVSIGDYQRDGLYDSQAVSMDPAFDHGKLHELNIRTGVARRYAIGLRNPQGLTIDGLGRIWETEHGPQGGDELNLIVEGRNYGWPVETFGMNYGSPPTPWRSASDRGRLDSSGQPRLVFPPFVETEHGLQGGDEINLVVDGRNDDWPVETHRSNYGSLPTPWRGADGGSNEDAYERPRFVFPPSTGISNLVAPDTREFPGWKNSLIVCSLAGNTMYVVGLEGEDVIFAEPIALGHRLRDIAVLPSGGMAVLADRGILLFIESARNSVEERPLEVSGLATLAPPSPEEAPGKSLSAAGRGQAYFAGSCASCHSIAGDILAGPPLDGVVGRPVASFEGYGYSDALKELGGVWTERRLASYVHYPNSVAPGSWMPPSGLHDGEARDVVAFLKALH